MAKEKRGLLKHALAFFGAAVKQDEEGDSYLEGVRKGSGMFVHRDLSPASSGALRGWAQGIGLFNVRWSDLFITIMNSSKPVQIAFAPESLKVELAGKNPKLVLLDDGAVALAFDCPELVARHAEFIAAGADWKFGDYRPHIILAEPASWAPDPKVPLNVNFDTLPAVVVLDGEEFCPASDDDDEGEESEEGVTEQVPNYEKHRMISFNFAKVNEEQRLVYGWASVVEKDGEPVVDHEGDIIEIGELQKAAHEFNMNVRLGKVSHEGEKVCDLVESVVMTKELQAALGIDLKKVGWLTCWKVHDDATWERVKRGDLKMFSIGGRGLRTPVNE